MTALRPAVSPLLLLCCMLLGLPRVGLAAEEEPPQEEPKQETLEDSWGGPGRHRAPLGFRLITEVATGAIASAASGSVLGLATYGVCKSLGPEAERHYGCVGFGLAASVLGLVEGYGLGLWWGGERVGGNGRLLFTLLGVTVGAVGSLSVAFLGGTKSALGLVAIPLPTLLLGHLGYELSQRAPPAVARASGPSLQPLLAVSSNGTMLGVGGRF